MWYTETMPKVNSAVLYIDGENLRYYIKKITTKHKITFNITDLDFTKLFSAALKEFPTQAQKYYSAKIKIHPDSPAKSNELIQRQRALKSNLEKQGVFFVTAGNVRAQKILDHGKEQLIFREKGVDVKIAVDMVIDSCDKKVKTVILCSSDSDLQPAVYEVKKRGVEIIYLGFESQPNKGLIFTCNRTILLRDTEILEAITKPPTQP